MLNNEKIQKISCAVIKTTYAKFLDFPIDASRNRNAPFHKAFLNAFSDKLEGKVSDIPFFISLSSWFHGLNTTLGQSFFEKVSHILSDGTKQEFKALKISQSQQTSIADIITELKNGIHTPNLTRENGIIFTNNTVQDKDASNFTADCFYEEADKLVAIELKTVKPNSGVFKNEKEKMLSAKAGLKNAHPTKDVLFYLGFPFDPLSDTATGSDKNRFMGYSVDFKKFFEPVEVLLADELWNFLSGDTNTMQQILDIINRIANPHFMENYNYLLDSNNIILNKPEFLTKLEEWNLFSEISLVKKNDEINSRIKGNRNLTRVYNQPLFKDGNYNKDRFSTLIPNSQNDHS